MEQNATSSRESLPVILAAAVVQGWALFGLHHAITTQTWPATNLAWLLALYSVVVLIPVTIQLLGRSDTRASRLDNCRAADHHFLLLWLASR